MRLQSTLYYSINDQSGPFSLIVMTPDFHPGDRGSRPALAGCFNLQVYISPPTTTSVSPSPKKGHGKVAKKGHFLTRGNVSKGHF